MNAESIVRWLRQNNRKSGWTDIDRMMDKSANLIESLQAELTASQRRERAAVEDLKTLEHATGYRLVCKYSSHGDCHCPNNKCGWQWRGVKGDAE